MNRRFSFVFSILLIFSFTRLSYAASTGTMDVSHDPSSKSIMISDADQNLVLRLNYSKGCKIAELKIKGKNTLSESGIYTGFRTKAGLFTSCAGLKDVQVEKSGNEIIIKNILYGDHSIRVKESWKFKKLKFQLALTPISHCFLLCLLLTTILVKQIYVYEKFHSFYRVSHNFHLLFENDKRRQSPSAGGDIEPTW